MEPSLAKHLDRLAERRPDVTALIAHLWELPTNEPADPLGWIGLSCSKPCGKAVTLATFCTNSTIPVDDRRLSRDLSAFDPGWLVDNLAKLAASKPWAGGVKRHQWPGWDYLFLDGYHDKPAELTFPAKWKPVEVVIPPRLLVACGDKVLVKPDGWFVEIPNVLPRLADLVGGEVQSREPADTPRWVVLSPAQLEAILDLSWDTIRKDIAQGRIAAKRVTSRRYEVDPRTLPNDWKRRVK